MRRTRCDHDRVFSGQTNLDRRFAFICSKCGECGWSENYVLDQVNFDEFCRQRVLHGWAAQQKLPPPPRLPTRTTPSPRAWPLGAIFFAFLAAVYALSAIHWGALGPILPFRTASLATGIALGTAILLYVVWKRGSSD